MITEVNTLWDKNTVEKLSSLNETQTPPHKKYKILLIGDSCTDVYVKGDVERLSPEAPVPVLSNITQTEKQGMAANVKANFLALGCTVDFITNCPEQITKTRYIDRRSNTQLLRVDKDANLKQYQLDKKDLNNYDAIVISDYHKGFVSYKLIEQIRDQFNGPVFLDTKKTHLAKFRDIYVKINEQEFDRRDSINNMLVVTLGERGAMYKTPDTETYFTAEPVEVTDVTGAGDTFLTGLTYLYLETRSIESAIEFANRASSITVQHLGVYAPSLEELK